MVSEKKNTRWFDTALAVPFLVAQNQVIKKLLERIYGYHLLCVGDTSFLNLVETSSIVHKILINPYLDINNINVNQINCALPELALRTNSVDMVFLPHVLEETDEPELLLKEAHRVLIPEGHLLLTGVNPLSWWGHWYKSNNPHPSRLLRVSKIKSWLNELEFELMACQFFAFTPPRTQMLGYLKFLENWGRFWPGLGGGYCLLAMKRQASLTLIKPRWKTRKVWVPQGALVPPSTRNS